MLKALYENVKVCVKLSPNMNYSECFDETLGLKQGNHSPRYFLYFYINNVSNNMDLNNLTENDLCR